MGVNFKTLTPAPPNAPKPKGGDIVEAHYTGWLSTKLGTKGKQFDSSRGLFKGPFKFALGRNEVIKAWDIGIAKMKVGEKALLKCTSDVCYGRDGAGPIPPNADLIFEVELLGIDGYKPNVFQSKKRGDGVRMMADAAEEEADYTIAAAAGLVANPIMWVSLGFVATTGGGLPAEWGPLVGALEGISYLIVVGFAGASLFSKVTTGSGLPAGRGGLLGAAEGLSFLSIVAGIGVLATLVGQQDCVPNALPIADYSDKVNVCR